MHIHDVGLELIKKFEGFRSTVYYDLAGKATIGYGHLIKPDESWTLLSRDQAEQLLEKDVEAAEEAVRSLTRVRLNENQFSALVSFVFNLGESAFASSTLLQRLNQRRYHDVPEQLLRWHRVGRQPIKGLIRRRAAEAELFIS